MIDIPTKVTVTITVALNLSVTVTLTHRVTLNLTPSLTLTLPVGAKGIASVATHVTTNLAKIKVRNRTKVGISVRM